MSERERCTATSRRSGERCKRYPALGATVCRTHGGAAPQVRARAKQRAAESEVRDYLEVLGVPEPVNPADALMDLIAAKNAEVRWLRARVKTFTPDSLVWGVSSHEEGFTAEGMVDKRTHKAEPNTWWKLLREAEDQLAEYTSKALRAGVDAARLRIAESQADKLIQVVETVLDGLALSAEQLDRVPVIVPAAFLAVGGGEA